MRSLQKLPSCKNWFGPWKPGWKKLWNQRWRSRKLISLNISWLPPSPRLLRATPVFTAWQLSTGVQYDYAVGLCLSWLVAIKEPFMVIAARWLFHWVNILLDWLFFYKFWSHQLPMFWFIYFLLLICNYIFNFYQTTKIKKRKRFVCCPTSPANACNKFSVRMTANPQPSDQHFNCWDSIYYHDIWGVTIATIEFYYLCIYSRCFSAFLGHMTHWLCLKQRCGHFILVWN